MRICSIGECMIELSNIEQNIFKLAHAGDTANTSIYLSRLGAKSSYFTSVGTDYLSEKLIKFLKNEKVITRNIHYNENKSIGLYLIQNNQKGERNFFYWRSDSAARTLFDKVNLKKLFEQIVKYEAIYFSGITLSIYNQKSINKFFFLKFSLILFLIFYIFMWKLEQMAGFGLRGIPNDIFQSSLFAEFVKFLKFLYKFIDLNIINLPRI